MSENQKPLSTPPAVPANPAPTPLAPTPNSRTANLQPITDEKAWALADRIKNSAIIPKDFIGKPENIFIAILMGRELGLHPMQSVQSIMVVNGRPTIWGDALKALVDASGLVEKCEEEIDPKGMWARCTVRRKGDTKDHVQEFTLEDAKKANLLGKPGPWQTNPKRMLQMRARAFALRDKFADVLKGIQVREEVEDYQFIPGDNRPPLQSPREVVDVPASTAEAYAAQEAAPTQEAPADPTEQRIQIARARFVTDLGVSTTAIDKWLAFKGAKTSEEIVDALTLVWKQIKKGTTSVSLEFDRFSEKPPATDQTEGDDTLFAK